MLPVIWSALDPFISKPTTTTSEFDIKWQCLSKYGDTWIVIEAVYFGVLLVTQNPQCFY